jgi:hypothetical protein
LAAPVCAQLGNNHSGLVASLANLATAVEAVEMGSALELGQNLLKIVQMWSGHGNCLNGREMLLILTFNNNLSFVFGGQTEVIQNKVARAKRHYIPGFLWHITHRCHKREFLPGYWTPMSLAGMGLRPRKLRATGQRCI